MIQNMLLQPAAKFITSQTPSKSFAALRDLFFCKQIFFTKFTRRNPIGPTP